MIIAYICMPRFGLPDWGPIHTVLSKLQQEEPVIQLQRAVAFLRPEHSIMCATKGISGRQKPS